MRDVVAIGGLRSPVELPVLSAVQDAVRGAAVYIGVAELSECEVPPVPEVE